MAHSIKVGDTVFASILKIDKEDVAPFSMVSGIVTGKSGRSAFVDLPYELGNHKIATSKLYKDVGILILKIGDLDTESTLLNPLSKSLLHYCKMLIPDDQLKCIDLRTWKEFKLIVSKYQSAYSHIIFVGHGGDDGSLLFAGEKRVAVGKLITFLESEKLSPKKFISLSCYTGNAIFGKLFSRSSVCAELLAPMGTVHVVSASQFAQTYLGYHFLEGCTSKVAFKKARIQTPGAGRFRYWTNGKFEGAK